MEVIMNIYANRNDPHTPAGHDDVFYMRHALDEANKAFERGEVPVGAVLVMGDEILERSFNQREESKDATAHAEMIALRNAAGKTDSWRMLGTTLYVTKEPCIMCAGAIMNARVRRLVYGCGDPKGGAVDSLYHILSDPRLNHKVEVCSGVLAVECAALLKGFFERRR